MLKESQLNTVNRDDTKLTLRDLLLKIVNYWRYLLSNWVIIIIFIVGGVIIGYSYSLYKKDLYISKTTFVLENGDQSSSLGQYAGLASMAGINLESGGGVFKGDNILELYKSRSMIKDALLAEVEVASGQSYLLIDKYMEMVDIKKSIPKISEIKPGLFKNKLGMPLTRHEDSLINVFVKQINKEYLTVGKPDVKLNIIEVKVSSPDEFFSKNFNQAIVSTVNEYYVRTKTKKSLENLKVLQYQTDSVRRMLDGAIYASATINDQTPNLNPTRQILRAPAQRSVLQQEVNKAMLSELVKNLEMSKITYRKELPLIQIIEDPVYPLEIKRFGKVVGMIFGGALGAILIIFFLTIRKILLGALSENH